MAEQYGTRVYATIVAGVDDDDDLASALNRQIQGSFQSFPTLESLHDWSDSYPSRVRGTTAFIDSDKSIHQWSGSSWKHKGNYNKTPPKPVPDSIHIVRDFRNVVGGVFTFSVDVPNDMVPAGWNVYGKMGGKVVDKNRGGFSYRSKVKQCTVFTGDFKEGYVTVEFWRYT
jgi:hypothetical protein